MSFRNPDLTASSPSPLWFWNDRLSTAEIWRQVGLMADAGIKNFLIHARWGLKTSYLTAEWWRMIASAVSAARANGSHAWFYDEYNYPSGICGGKVSSQEKFREKFLAYVVGTSVRGETVSLTLPEGSVVGAYAYPLVNGRLDEARAIDLGDRMRKGELAFSPASSKPHRVYVFVVQTEPLEGWGLGSINYLDPAPTREFIRLTHEAYAARYRKLFGNDVPYFFFDEPRFNNALPWSDGLPAFFKRTKGYDIRSLLPLLIESGTALTTRVRCDYYDAIADLYSRCFFEPLGKWCRQHRVGLTGHLMAEETLGGNTRYSGHGMKHFRHIPMPGADFLGKGIGGLAVKIASSAAHHLGNRPVSCETFAGCGWKFTMAEMNVITHWLFCQGASRIIPHAFFYSTKGNRKNDWPPSLFFQWKDWKKMPRYAERASRLTEIFTGGRHVADIAVYYPIESFQAAYEPDTRYKTGYNEKGPRLAGGAFAVESCYQRIAHLLQTHHRDYDLVDAQTLCTFDVRNKRLVCKQSKETYRLLILPHVTTLPIEAAQFIRKFAAAGGAVLALDTVPVHSTENENDGRIATMTKKLFSASRGNAILGKNTLEKSSGCLGVLRIIDRLLRAPDISLSGSHRLYGEYLELDQRIHDPYVHTNLEKLLREKRGGVSAYHYIKAGRHFVLLANCVPEQVSFTATFRDAIGEKVKFMWPGTGNETMVDAELVRDRRKQNTVRVTIPPLEAVVVSFS